MVYYCILHYLFLLCKRFISFGNFIDAVYGFHSLIDIVVTTPGRLVEHLKYTPGFSLSNLKFLVIDEADHVMDSMQNDWIHHLYNFIPPFSKWK